MLKTDLIPKAILVAVYLLPHHGALSNDCLRGVVDVFSSTIGEGRGKFHFLMVIPRQPARFLAVLS